MYYDSYWESLKFSPAEREAWRTAFPPEVPDGFEIAPRTARRWTDAGYTAAEARAAFETAGIDHVDARRWGWADPATALRWHRAAFAAEAAAEWAKGFTLDEALAWRNAGFGPYDAHGWSLAVGVDAPGAAQAWVEAGFVLEEALSAIRRGEPPEVARLRRLSDEAPGGRHNGGARRRR